MKIYMQILGLLLLAYAVVSRVTPSNKFEEGLLKVIDRWKNGDIQSLPVPLPSLNSINIPSIEVRRDGNKMSLHAIEIKGLEDLTVHKLSASPSDKTLSLEFFIPALTVRADRYHLQGQAFIFSINDWGVLKANINNIKVHADVQFGASGTDTDLTALKLHYSVGAIKLHLSGSSSLVTSRVKSKISHMIREKETKEKIKHLIINKAHEYLRGHSLQEIVETISAI